MNGFGQPLAWVEVRPRQVLGADEAAAEGDQRSAQPARHVNAAFYKVNAALAPGGLNRHQRRFVRRHWIEEMGSSGHAGRLDAQLVELAADPVQIGVVNAERVELVVVEGYYNAVVAGQGHGVQGSGKVQPRQPECAVGRSEEHT